VAATTPANSWPGDDRALVAEGLHPVLIEAGVGAADAGGGDLQQQLVAARLRDRQLRSVRPSARAGRPLASTHPSLLLLPGSRTERSKGGRILSNSVDKSMPVLQQNRMK
jgi:hypothetical protein